MVATWVRQFGVVLLGWISLTLGLTALAGGWSPVRYFLLAYVGFLLAVEVSAPDGPRPTNHRRLRWLSVIGFAVFVYLLVSWVQTVLANTSV